MKVTRATGWILIVGLGLVGLPARGFTGFDYLLCPALSWPADKDFRFSVTVEIPYYHGKFLVFPRWDEPQAKANLSGR
jgi:hypothetical protein